MDGWMEVNGWMDGLLLPSYTLVKAVQLLIYVEEARTKAQLLFFINDKNKTKP